MGSGKKKSDKNDDNFCFCVGLRLGFIITSLAWLIESSILAILFRIAWTNDDNNIDVLVKPLGIIIILFCYSVMLFLLSVFGLVSYYVYKSSTALRLYKYAAWLIAVFINTVLVIVTVISIAYSKKQPDEDDSKKQPDEDAKANSYIVGFAVLAAIQIGFHIYFTIILQAFVHRYEKVERRQQRKSHTQPTFSKIDDI